MIIASSYGGGYYYYGYNDDDTYYTSSSDGDAAAILAGIFVPMFCLGFCIATYCVVKMRRREALEAQ